MNVVRREQIEKTIKENIAFHEKQTWCGYLIRRQPALVGIGLTTFLVMAAIFAMRAYKHYQNEKIESIDCHFGKNINGVVRNFNYYKYAAANGGLATDQYCLAEAFKKGEGIDISLEDARNWYKEAADQGLTLAKKVLCVPDMFEHKFPFGTLYSEFRLLCCKEILLNDAAYSCPWDKW